jgi:hypothetical protein
MRYVVFGTVLVLSAAAGGVAAQTSFLPENTINCSSLRKLENGNWFAASTTFNFGKHKMILANQEIGRRFFSADGVDLYDTIERKCGGLPI